LQGEDWEVLGLFDGEVEMDSVALQVLEKIRCACRQ